MAELGGAVRVEWTGPHDRQLGKWHLRVALSTDGRLDLIQPEAGSPWESPGGPGLDHLAYFVDDLLDRAAFHRSGPADGNRRREFGGTWSYHASSHGGMRIELVDAASARHISPGVRYVLMSSSNAEPNPSWLSELRPGAGARRNCTRQGGRHAS